MASYVSSQCNSTQKDLLVAVQRVHHEVQNLDHLGLEAVALLLCLYAHRRLPVWKGQLSGDMQRLHKAIWRFKRLLDALQEMQSLCAVDETVIISQADVGATARVAEARTTSSSPCATPRAPGSRRRRTVDRQDVSGSRCRAMPTSPLRSCSRNLPRAASSRNALTLSAIFSTARVYVLMTGDKQAVVRINGEADVRVLRQEHRILVLGGGEEQRVPGVESRDRGNQQLGQSNQLAQLYA